MSKSNVGNITRKPKKSKQDIEIELVDDSEVATTAAGVWNYATIEHYINQHKPFSDLQSAYQITGDDLIDAKHLWKHAIQTHRSWLASADPDACKSLWDQREIVDPTIPEPDPVPLIENALYRGENLCIIGDVKSCKTTLLAALFVSLNTGVDFLGDSRFKVHQTGPCLGFFGENSRRSIRRNMELLAAEYGKKIDWDMFNFWTRIKLDLHKPERVEEMARLCEERKILLCAIDPEYRAFGKEVDTANVSQKGSVVGELFDAIIGAGTIPALVTHTRKQGSQKTPFHKMSITDLLSETSGAGIQQAAAQTMFVGVANDSKADEGIKTLFVQIGARDDVPVSKLAVEAVRIDGEHSRRAMTARPWANYKEEAAEEREAIKDEMAVHIEAGLSAVLAPRVIKNIKVAKRLCEEYCEDRGWDTGRGFGVRMDECWDSLVAIGHIIKLEEGYSWKRELLIDVSEENKNE